MQPPKGLDPLVLWAHRVCRPDTARVYETQEIARKPSGFGADFSRLKTSKECSAWNTAVRLRAGTWRALGIEIGGGEQMQSVGSGTRGIRGLGAVAAVAIVVLALAACGGSSGGSTNSSGA